MCVQSFTHSAGLFVLGPGADLGALSNSSHEAHKPKNAPLVLLIIINLYLAVFLSNIT